MPIALWSGVTAAPQTRGLGGAGVQAWTPQTAPVDPKQPFNLGSIKDVPALNTALKAGQINQNQWMSQFKIIQAKTNGPKVQTGLAQNLNPFNKQSVVYQQDVQPVAHTLGGAVTKAMNQAKYLAGPTSTQQQRNSITTNQTAAAKNPEFTAAMKSVKPGQNSAAGLIQAEKLAAQGAKAPQIKTFLQQDAQGLNKQTKAGINTIATVAGFSAPGEGILAKGLGKAKEALAGKEAEALPAVIHGPNGDVPVRPSAMDNQLPSPAGAKSPAETSSSVAGKKVATTAQQGSVQKANKIGEEGGVNPGAAVQDAKTLIQKHQDSVKYGGDIRNFVASSEGAKGNLLNDANQLIKNRTQLSNTDKTLLQDYRDAKAAGQTPASLPARLQKVDEETTAFAKAKNAADIERAKLEGNLQKAKTLESTNPEAYTHRAAQGKGGAFDYVLQNDRKNPLSVGLGKTTSADKARNMFSLTDKEGNTRTVSIKTQITRSGQGQKVIKPNQVIAYSNGGKTSEVLGSIKSKAGIEGKTFVGKDGQTYKVGQAGASQITKDTGTKYYVDPHLNNMASYLDSRVALENARMFETIKKSPLSDKFMSGPEETAPKGWKSVPGLDQFRGYRFEPRVADALHDTFVRSKGEPDLLNKVGQTLRQTIVYFPVKHDFNILSSYAVDRGLSGLARPYPALKSLFLAAQDVSHNTPFYQELAKKGLNLTTNDRAAFEKTFSKELNKLADNKPIINSVAKAVGTSPVRLYKAIQRVSVWDVQDIANIARVRERMASGPLKKGLSMEDAIKQTERFGFQYQVPERVVGTRTGSQLLQSDKIFFGRYRYDQYKIVGNIVKDALKVNHPKQAAEALDKMAALMVGALVAWPIVNKGVQAATGNKNAYITAPGPMQLPELVNKVRKGKEDAGTAAGNQVYLGPLQAALDLKNNTDSFTGNKIRDPNLSTKEQGKQVGDWLKTQFAPTQKLASGKNAKSNPVVTTLLSLSGTTLPKNSPLANKLNSLKFDTLPNVQKQAKTQGSTGNLIAAMNTIKQYDASVLKAAKADLADKGVAVPPDQELIKQLKKSGFYYQPKQSTVQNWSKPKKVVTGAFKP